MENILVYVMIAVVAFLLGRASKSTTSLSGDSFATSPILSQRERPVKEDVKTLTTSRRVFTLLFLTGWIVGWSIGIILAFGMFLGSLGDGLFVTIFIGGWLMAAVAGWFFVARTIYELITGSPSRMLGAR